MMPATIPGRLLTFLATVLLVASSSSAEEPISVKGLKNPESVVLGPGGKIYVTEIGDRDTQGDGLIAIVDLSGKITTFATGLDDPKGMVYVGDFLYVADVKKVWKINGRGKTEVFVAPTDFPRPPIYLDDITFDGIGNFYVSDSGDRAGHKGAVFQINARKKVSLILDGELTDPQIMVPCGLLSDDPDHLFVADYGMGYLYRFDLITGTPQRMGGGFGGIDGITRDSVGQLYLGDWRNGRLFQLISDLEPPRLLSDRFQSAADMTFTADGRYLLVLDMKAGTLTWLPTKGF